MLRSLVGSEMCIRDRYEGGQAQESSGPDGEESQGQTGSSTDSQWRHLTTTSLGKFLHSISGGEPVGEVNRFEDPYGETAQTNAENRQPHTLEETAKHQVEQGHQNQNTQGAEATTDVEGVETSVTFEEQEKTTTDTEDLGQPPNHSPCLLYTSPSPRDS